MWRTILFYAAILALGTFALQWVEYQYLSRSFSIEIYVVLVGIAFTVLGVWVGRALTRQTVAEGFEFNQALMTSLNITKRELGVLEELAEGHSNKQIAERLNVSPNTVKTHIANLYEKLEVGQRVQAVQKARTLRLIR
ncbi:MAG: response regulator transcription factor [Pseudomonadota bacterium]